MKTIKELEKEIKDGRKKVFNGEIEIMILKDWKNNKNEKQNNQRI